ncbi:N-acetyltransferase [Candidatus Sodalis sp. SoCistrobi]|uniref:GNAT family N-acetyltransferase n=1 Tax=Candidatus Sodalis sp. SoCistrobi TaxID=1922216 RepID=UPI000939F568|nr:GNAT family N-acetyltransferase [Candidatus Sodalis sp. SoCistrobi]
MEQHNLHFTLSDVADDAEEKLIQQKLWSHNAHFQAVDMRPLRLTITNDAGDIVAGLLASTWWGSLEIQYLWIDERHRYGGLGRQLIHRAETEALARGCHQAYLDTFSFQALGFYEKLGYRRYGHLAGYAHKHTRYYLAKALPAAAAQGEDQRAESAESADRH